MTLPNPIPIIIPALEDTQQTFQISLGELEAILRDPRIADKKVCVVSVAGAFRTGKSFILNFFLRYLQWKTSEGNNETDLDWLTTKIQLNGFSWRGGDDRDTNGILIWPEAFILDDRNGEEIVTILMDTQGIFDCTSTVKSCATIFALSTMISSVQVYNIHNTIQEDHLQHLHLFTEYARLAMDEYNDAKPFQTLMFLVRDWSYPYVAEYGLDGGQRILEKRLLEVAPNQHKELQQLRQHIKSSFDNIQCFLMPHPGLDVTTNPNFRGELVSISADFKTQLRVLIPHLFDPDNLVVKTVNGQHVTCRELAVYINAYFDVFNGAELPEPKTILNATAEANNLAAVARSKAMYMKEMEKICDTPFMTSAQLREHHNRCQANAVQLFDTAKKMGGQKLAENFRGRLLEGIQEAFEFFVRTNNANSNNLFLPMVMSLCTYLFAALLVIQYIFHELLQQLGLNMMTLMLAIVIVLLFAWHSGHLKGAQKTLMDCLLKPSVVKKDM